MWCMINVVKDTLKKSFALFQLVLSSLESLYNLSGVGQVTSDHIAEVHHSIGMGVLLH